ncbi:hypothetical protein RND81_06G173500 [Saponaria officinalis]|uniref:Retrotransposon Copia-like N-terminal domain-containing protein n=1 Tax=Saponaria officinalis TaxID=3572 RepID=A0AAW1KB32_SAPOF
MTGSDATPPPTQQIDPTSPFYLGSNDLPGAKISTVILRRDNYDDWKKSMRMSLKSQRKFGFIDKTIKNPTDAFYLDQWDVIHCTLVQWIRNTIDPSLLDIISYVDDAAVLWAELEEQFGVVDGTMIHGLKTQLHQCKQTKGMDVTTYYVKLKSIWDALIVHEPPFACECGKCECNIGPAALKRLDNERLHQFFMGLDDTLYRNVRSQQFQLDPLPSLSRAYHSVLQEERLHAPSDVAPDASEVVAFAMPPAGRQSVDWRALRDKERGERRGLFCSYCETRGHEPPNCYIKNQRFPDWWGDRPRSLTELRRARTEGASRAPGGSSKGKNASGNGPAVGSAAASTSASIPPVVHANLVTSGVTTNSIISSDRLSGMCSWIIDTGASNHVTGDLSSLEDCETIVARPVGLPNGQRVESTIMGSVYINEFFTLSRVLFVPSITCNLLSLSQLASEHDFSFEFANHSCSIQDRTMRRTIGAGELRDGLYWMRVGARTVGVHQVSSQDSREIWHQ